MIKRSFKPLLEKAGLPPIRFHALRHTAATLLLPQGVHPRVVEEMFGHSSITLTMDTYSDVLPSMQNVVVENLTPVVRGALTAKATGRFLSGLWIRIEKLTS